MFRGKLARAQLQLLERQRRTRARKVVVDVGKVSSCLAMGRGGADGPPFRLQAQCHISNRAIIHT